MFISNGEYTSESYLCLVISFFLSDNTKVAIFTGLSKNNQLINLNNMLIEYNKKVGSIYHRQSPQKNNLNISKILIF